MSILELGIMRHDINNPQKSQELIDWAMLNGINHFESCWFYMDYKCEEFLYDKLKQYPRNSYYICGKMPIHGIVQYQNFEEIFKTQLERVPGNYFDTYLLQALDERAILDLYENKIIKYFLKKKKENKIHRFGLSIQCRPETFKKLLELKCWDVVQMPLNYFDYYLCRYDENYKLALEYNLPIIAQAPVKGGLLINPNYINESLFSNNSLVEVAFNFINNLPGIEMILCGNSSLDTFKNTVQAFEKKANINSENYLQAINNYKQNNKISCLECGRCTLSCPQHLPISAYIQLYNLALYDKKYFNAFDILKNSPDEPNHLCTPNCNKCVHNCPIGNNIPLLFHKQIFELRT